MLVAAALPASAQEIALWIDAATSHAQPPAGVTGDPTLYGVYGLQVEAGTPWMDFDAGARLGHALSGSEGRWVQSRIAASGGTRMGRLSLRGSLAGFRLDYLDPFDFAASGVDLNPALALRLGGLDLALSPRASLGSWSTDTLEGDLRVAGADLGIERRLGPVLLAGTVGALHAENGATEGTFVQGDAAAALTRGRWTVTAGLGTQRTPLETETGARVALSGAVRAGLRAYVAAGRTLRDPLFGTPGALSVSAGISVRPVRWTAPTAPPVAAIGAPDEGARPVRFSIRAPGAERVELAGDFSEWAPIPMERVGDRWTVERRLSPGVHHFSFLVDGEWALPDDAPGVVEDGWGRENASIVIEP